MIDDFVTAKALVDKIEAFAILHNYRLSKQDAAFTPDPEEVYLKETFLPNDTNPLGLAANSSDEQKPIYQVDIFTPKTFDSKFPAQAIANLIKAEFPRADFIVNTSEQTVKISNVSARPMPNNKTHLWTMVNIDLVVLACNS